jgi:hypothetical protein
MNNHDGGCRERKIVRVEKNRKRRVVEGYFQQQSGARVWSG